MRFELLPGQRYDTVGVAPLIEGVAFGGLIADKAFDVDWIVAELDERGAQVVISQHPRRTKPRPIDADLYRCDGGHQDGEPAGAGEAGVLEVEAAGLGVGEEALDRPALAVGVEGGARRQVGDDDQPLVLEPPGGEAEEGGAAGEGLVAGAHAGMEEAGAAGAAEPGVKGELVARLRR